MPDLSGAPDPICWSQGRGYLRIGTTRYLRKTLRREQLTGGVTPPSAIAVTDLDFGAVVPAYLCAY